MTRIIQAVYEGGVFKPREPVSLEEGAEVELTVRVASPFVPADPAALLRCL